MSAGLMILRAAETEERKAWTELWSSSPIQHPFAHPEVCALLGPAEGTLMAATMSLGGGRVLHPFFLRRIDGGTTAGPTRCDLISPYGYGGPLHWGFADVDEAARLFWTEFDAWAEDKGVVSEFLRFSLFAEEVLPYPGPIRQRQVNFVRDLTVTDDELLSLSAPKVRSNARRAVREGVTIEIDTQGELLDDFLRIYLSTMERRSSAAWYRFDRLFFERLQAALPGRFAYVCARHEGRVVSADLVLLDRDTGYYFLGGTDAEAYSVRPNDLVKVEVMRWLRTLGRHRYVLGGGVSAGDGLERYKRGFAPQGGIAFRTGERVLDRRRYDELTEAARRRAETGGSAWDSDDDFFPAYRRPCSIPSIRENTPVRS